MISCYFRLVLLGVLDQVFVVVMVVVRVHVFDLLVAVLDIVAVVEHVSDAVHEELPISVEFHLY
jgi:hypothetical protein